MNKSLYAKAEIFGLEFIVQYDYYPGTNSILIWGYYDMKMKNITEQMTAGLSFDQTKKISLDTLKYHMTFKQFKQNLEFCIGAVSNDFVRERLVSHQAGTFKKDYPELSRYYHILKN